MIKLYNTLSAKKEEFVPVQPGRVSIYACGVTVYDHSHLGHARGAVVFDLIRRYFIRKGFAVTYVRNFTDVDDKIINRAKQEGITAEAVAKKYIDAYNEDMGRLGVARADIEPKATEHIPEMVAVIKGLIEKGHAYTVDGDVYFRVASFSGYGKLSKRNIEDLKAGARVEVDERKDDPLDFALWKASKPGEPAWSSPWGPGRPGWHIECSAMSFKHLGETFDIHGGGKDLIFPHHENEIAQSEAFSGRPFVNYWLHNGFVNINQEKMSKSLGNFFTIREILDKYDGEIVRLFLLSTHYRSPIDFSDGNLKDGRAGLDRFYTMKEGIAEYLKGKSATTAQPDKVVESVDRPLYEKILKLPKAFEEAMDDDFNTAFAIGLIYDLVRDVNKFLAEAGQKGEDAAQIILRAAQTSFDDVGRTLGLFLREPGEWFEEGRRAESRVTLSLEKIEEYIHLRNEARAGKDWAEADRVRQLLDAAGVEVFDRPGGTVWKPK
ncbi:MAG: cysteine--tRNA ligase [Nitrospirae bacterium GWC2_57_13]|jgi:cysteinyl-tRNA synthetase|nr:MAG: cysteine--tRNA ligase [Nitrospirae bacterium GWC2_57_13]HAS53748.1 cysteine--tRNA ligase [Nitrospiraceae bacterium]